MTLMLAVLVAWLFAVGTYLLLQRALTRIVLGLGVLSHGAILLLITVGGRAGRPPLVGKGDDASGIAAPLPQAFALTAIVIGFGMTSFLLALAYRSWVGTSNDEVQDDVEDKRVAQLMADEEGHFRPVEPADDEPWDEWDDDTALDNTAPDNTGAAP
ncbi:MAG: NADH-quinone oxidoreductase subunit K [Acidimicrobiia bacterium]|nr:NADH-quinone oxidoreductase subunit K [Acidimicrobiia bacterium]